MRHKPSTQIDLENDGETGHLGGVEPLYIALYNVYEAACNHGELSGGDFYAVLWELHPVSGPILSL